jgi:hypothetical protein
LEVLEQVVRDAAAAAKREPAHGVARILAPA